MMKRILLVEDSPSQSDGVRWALAQQSDYDITHVDSFNEVYNLISSGVRFDCAIIDIVIYQQERNSRSNDDKPDFPNGFGAVREILKLLPKEKILIYTLYPNGEIAKFIESGGLRQRLLVKPAHIRDLEMNVRAMLSQ
ncbi:MAG: hypothetical protein U0930_13455 [Pirellulales bacterium]